MSAESSSTEPKSGFFFSSFSLSQAHRVLDTPPFRRDADAASACSVVVFRNQSVKFETPKYYVRPLALLNSFAFITNALQSARIPPNRSAAPAHGTLSMSNYYYFWVNCSAVGGGHPPGGGRGRKRRPGPKRACYICGKRCHLMADCPLRVAVNALAAADRPP
ncbi:hypothetical protein ACCO45_004708 [Purpureocillium lilacinum]|uniref:Uncharacterized protein n=1 Tax=Purpureocillium lilacinum TaxID=33203 RepID=A0ACC4DW05_PURLI